MSTSGYYGALQMDSTFFQTFAKEHWPIAEPAPGPKPTHSIYVISVHVPKRGSESVRPEVYTDFAKALAAYQHQCGTNVALTETVDACVMTHWKTRVVTRFDRFEIPLEGDS